MPRTVFAEEPNIELRSQIDENQRFILKHIIEKHSVVYPLQADCSRQKGIVMMPNESKGR